MVEELLGFLGFGGAWIEDFPIAWTKSKYNICEFIACMCVLDDSLVELN